MNKPRTPSIKRRRVLARRLLTGGDDLLALLDEHRFTPADVHAWLADTTDADHLRAVVRLADLHAQLLLSRYRLSAVMRLIALATDDDPKQREPARRACVDLLKANLDATPPSTTASETAQDADAPADLRALLYADLPEAPPSAK